ncbi:MAG: O-linked N-acetylglucosamine transferase family protein [Sulfobacillus sp.]
MDELDPRVPPPDPLHFDTDRWLKLYINGEHLELSREFVFAFQALQRHQYVSLAAEGLMRIDNFVSTFLYLFTRRDYEVPPELAATFLRQNALLANLVAISSTCTTDSALEMVLRHPHNLLKVLVLYSAYNTSRVEPKVLFDASPHWAGIWYNYFFHLYPTALASKNGYQHLQSHLSNLDERFKDVRDCHHAYFGSSYVDVLGSKRLKQQLNVVTKAVGITINNHPKAGRIAVISGSWRFGHSVYRTQRDFVRKLAEKHEVTLFYVGPPSGSVDGEGFKMAWALNMMNHHLPLPGLEENEFSLVYFTDVGMHPETIVLSNMRLAPVQVCGYGHPFSTWGSEIDYWIGGSEVEVVGDAEENYSERMVLLPGLGIGQALPQVARGESQPRTDRFIINCPWYPQKVNYEMLELLNATLQESGVDVLFRFFSGGGILSDNGYIPFARTLEQALGSRNVEVIKYVPYDEYLALIEEGQFSLESHPFGGCNTIVDSLYAKRPVVCLEGKGWYNRIGAALLRRVGLHELIATSRDSYSDIVLKLIKDQVFRNRIWTQCQQVDIGKAFEPSEAGAFNAAIDYLMHNHLSLRAENSRKPIMVQRKPAVQSRPAQGAPR